MTDNSNQFNHYPSLMPIAEFCKKHSWPSQSSLRWMIFNAKKNGFDRVIRRCGKRILICEEEFYKWIDNLPENRGVKK